MGVDAVAVMLEGRSDGSGGFGVPMQVALLMAWWLSSRMNGDWGEAGQVRESRRAYGAF